jgi:hypothetical protein
MSTINYIHGCGCHLDIGDVELYYMLLALMQHCSYPQLVEVQETIHKPRSGRIGTYF